MSKHHYTRRSSLGDEGEKEKRGERERAARSDCSRYNYQGRREKRTDRETERETEREREREREREKEGERERERKRELGEGEREMGRKRAVTRRGRGRASNK